MAPLFIAEAVKGWLEASGVSTLYIEPQVLPGRTLTQRPSTVASETSYWIGRCLEQRIRQGYWPEIIERITTTIGRTALDYQTPAEFGALCEASKEEMNITKELESTPVLS
jgi:hypothetical protein